jgi:hypothetical protein
VPAAISTRSKRRATPLALLLHFVAADAGAMIDDVNQWVVFLPQVLLLHRLQCVSWLWNEMASCGACMDIYSPSKPWAAAVSVL